MKIATSSNPAKTEALFVFLPQKNWKKQFIALDKKLEKEITKRFSDKDFKGELGEILQLFSPLAASKKIFLVGSGKLKEKIDMRKVAGLAIRKAKKLKISQVAFLIPESFCVKRIISGAILGDYEFKIGDRSKQFSPKKLEIITNQEISKEDLQSEIALGESTNLTRDLINLPPNKMTPKLLRKKAEKELGKEVAIESYNKQDVQKLKMGALYGVGQGSEEGAELIVLKYKGGRKEEKPLAIVGKGVCFDSGGYNLKPTNHIEDMKSDMSGAATVLGIFKWIAATKPKKNIVGVIGAVENLVSGNAFKPGDILTAMNGQTIEITNTDAEGRLVLADCLYYTATKLNPVEIIDIATLTGACIAALGMKISAVMGNNKKLIERVKKAALAADENVWELPVNDFFREKTKGDISDLVNWTAGVSAGSSMGGAFLEKFVEKVPWIHLDVAGTAFHAKAEDELSPKGATGVMVRTLKRLIEE